MAKVLARPHAPAVSARSARSARSITRRRFPKPAPDVPVRRYYNPKKLFAGKLVPASILERTDITFCAKLVFAVLIHHSGENGRVYPSQELIAKEVGGCIRSVRAALELLVERNLLEIVRPTGMKRAKHLNNEYLFIWTDELAECLRVGASVYPQKEREETRDKTAEEMDAETGEEVRPAKVAARGVRGGDRQELPLDERQELPAHGQARNASPLCNQSMVNRALSGGGQSRPARRFENPPQGRLFGSIPSGAGGSNGHTTGAPGSAPLDEKAEAARRDKFRRTFCRLWEEKYAKPYPFDAQRGKNYAAIKTLYLAFAGDRDEYRKVVTRYLAEGACFFHGHPLAKLVGNLPEFLTERMQPRFDNDGNEVIPEEGYTVTSVVVGEPEMMTEAKMERIWAGLDE